MTDTHDDPHDRPHDGIDWYALLVLVTFLAFALSNAMAWSGVLPIPLEVIVVLAILSLVVLIPVFTGRR